MRTAEREKWLSLLRTEKDNARMLELLSRYLTFRAGWVTAGDIEAVSACGVPEELAYQMLMAAGMGWTSRTRRRTAVWRWTM